MEIKMAVKVLFTVLMIAHYALSDQVAVGGIFYSDDEDLKVAMTVSAKLFNYTALVKEVSKRGDILEITGHVCDLAGKGVIGIIDGLGGKATEHLQGLCDILELPLIEIQHNDLYMGNWSLINLYPSPVAFNMVLEQLILKKEWYNFTLLYVKGHSTTKVQSLMQMGQPSDRVTVTVRELSGKDYRDVLIKTKESGHTNFVVDCPSENLEQILKHAQHVGLMADEHSYVFASPDLFTLDLHRYRYGGVNMTGFQLINLNSPNLLDEFLSSYNEESGNMLSPESLRSKVVLIYDAIFMLYQAVSKINIKSVIVKPMSLDCEKYESWIYGSTLLNVMKTNKIEGITRNIIFDGFGQRNNVTMDILELTSAGNQTIATWHNDELTITRSYTSAADITEETIMKNKTFKVLISKTAPYGYEKKSPDHLEGNNRYEGFTIDLIEKIAEMLGFNYEFELEADYGGIDTVTHKWTGMVLKLMEEKADFAICDFTITAERQSGIDFSTPFMTLGIGILYKEPSKQPPEMFSFMAVFSKEVWYYMMFVQMGLGVLMIFVGRISHKEWQNPVPCIEQPEELTNQFSFANSVWLIIGSVMQQGSEIAPIALGPRIITSVWWFFTMVMVASYVGTLVAFLIVEKDVLPFKNVKELAEHKSISYGAKSRGSTIEFFKKSTVPEYQKMYEKMKKNGWLVNDNDIGVKLAETKPYAFFMESTSIEYTTQRHCDLIQIGGLLDSKGYGIGMKKGSPYKVYIDEALLKLKENGDIQKLKDLWWKEKMGGGKCGDKRNEEPKQLGMRNMLGAFVVLGVGCLLGILISTLDMLWGIFKKSVKYNTTFKYELIEELKFALKFSGDIKPVKRPPKSGGSTEPFTDMEGKDEITSLRSIRSGRSTDTHRTNHSHKSRHSSRELSVAFARRREYS
ncbi:glutamate receptor ionotropic, kainate 3-like [Melitaea cinxia]|uniref:glutamate receptor ionotropic, kainate 3-like n=1 Tax=Melitaea cinxia TaxID=113334 RepID=UPI001E273B69|nr:glutamate receptor ionotropic, kainate 3-like [Melitaea cinxia]